MKSIRPCLAALLALAFLVNLAGCTPKPVIPLSVFAAGSLIQPFNELEKAFETRYPYIDVLPEYHGSIQVIRHATELHEPIDVVATADASLLPMLMYGATVPETGKPYADWHIRFASNRLALAYPYRRLASLAPVDMEEDQFVGIPGYLRGMESCRSLVMLA